MNKRKLTLILLFVVMFFLGGIVFFVFRQPTDEIIDKPIDESVIIYNFSINELESIELILPTGESETYKKDNDYQWIAQDKDYSLMQNNVDMLAYSILSLTAIGIVEEEAPLDLAPYGLDKPSKVVATLIDKTELIVYCGSKTPHRSSYYAMVNNDNAIYEIYSSYANAFLSSPNDLREKMIISTVNVETLERFTILRQGKETIDISMMQQESKNSPNIQFSDFQMIEPFLRNHDVSLEKYRKLIDNLNSLAITKDIADENATDFAQYGLDNPQMELTIADSNQQVILLIGNIDTRDGTSVYCMIKGEQIVYTVEKAKIEYFDAVQPIDLILRFVLLANIEAMDEVIIKGYDMEYIMEIQREEGDEDANKDGVMDTSSIYFINSNQVDESSFKAIYQLVVGMLADGVTDKQTDIMDSQVTIEYINNIDGVDNDIVSFVEYNEHFYVAYCNDVDEFVISKQEVEKLFESLASLSLDN